MKFSWLPLGLTIFALQNSAAFAVKGFFKHTSLQVSCEANFQVQVASFSEPFELTADNSERLKVLAGIATGTAQRVGVVEDAQAVIIRTAESWGGTYGAHYRLDDSFYYFAGNVFRYRGTSLAVVPYSHINFVLATLFGRDIADYNRLELNAILANENGFQVYRGLKSKILDFFSSEDTSWSFEHEHAIHGRNVLLGTRKFRRNGTEFVLSISLAQGEQKVMVSFEGQAIDATSVETRLKRECKRMGEFVKTVTRDETLVHAIVLDPSNFHRPVEEIIKYIESFPAD